ncbi:hypothetical protein An01g12070 [Aspergillus niger]|uniref:Uncharacterized protein n=2 Tax=Aspergillus niger TaxID=5061 RepID=A2QAM6_ASPNC|nr:hypothetical protein An01g12070 [Aspergillus niger]CAK44107.1 hypothetical protein An01g12070 [Aspergillus niger]
MAKTWSAATRLDFPPDPAIAVIFRGGADLGSGDDGDSEVRDAATSYPGESERCSRRIRLSISSVSGPKLTTGSSIHSVRTVDQT